MVILLIVFGIIILVITFIIIWMCVRCRKRRIYMTKAPPVNNIQLGAIIPSSSPEYPQTS